MANLFDFDSSMPMLSSVIVYSDTKICVNQYISEYN